MSQFDERLAKQKREYEGKIAELFGRIDKIVSDRNELEKLYRKQQEIIMQYQAWFKRHEYLIKPRKRKVIPTNPVPIEGDAV